MTIELPVEVDTSLIQGFMDGLRPDPTITVSQWSDEKRILPDTTAEAGRWKTDRTPYLREIMDKLSVTDPAQKVVFQKGSQIGGTETGNNWLGYVIDVAPAPFLYIMPTDALMKKTSKQRIEKMLESTPELKAKTPRLRSRDSVNNLLYKEFPGMFLSMVGANSPVGLSSTSVRYVYGDEIDRYPVSVAEEGSALDLGETRTATYGNRRKIFWTSTPKHKGSGIDAEFVKTGQRYYNVPCPLCGVFQVLVFDQLRYEPGKYQDVKYECPHCNGLFEERHKTRIMDQGQWIPKYPEMEDGYTFGYHLSAMYSPLGWYSWAKMAQDYENAKGNVPKLIAFTNTKLGQYYEALKGDKPDWEQLYERSEDYPANQPFSSVVFITAGVDVQADRLEIEIVGWMKGKKSQSIDYLQLIGDTGQDEVWKELTKLLNKTWVRQGDNAILSIRLMGVDTGYNTQKAYQFAKKHGISRVMPLKGRESLDMYFAAPKSVDVLKAGQKAGKVKVWGVGVSMIKTEVYGFLKLQKDYETGEIPDGYCHFPKREPSYFRGLTAEEAVQMTNKRNYESFVWIKKYKRNEPLDCRVYARAAAAAAGMDNWNDDRWAKEMGNNEGIPVPRAQKPASDKPPKKNNSSSFWG